MRNNSHPFGYFQMRQQSERLRYSTVRSIRGVELNRDRSFSSNFLNEGQNKMTLLNLRNVALKWGGGR